MGKVIQMINTSKENSIFICGFDVKTNILNFRSSYDPVYLQSERIAFVGDNIKTNLYFFNKGFLQKFISDNQLVN